MQKIIAPFDGYTIIIQPIKKHCKKSSDKEKFSAFYHRLSY